MAEEFHKLGGQVILCARNLEELKKVKNELIKKYPQISAKKEPEIVCLDVSSPLEVIEQKYKEIIDKFKTVDILINNAGVGFRGEVSKIKTHLI
jgi:NADP-dependent 3-hydroxy acid dehydrogenase YdfG